MRTLELTTPLMQGEDVRRLQTLLIKHGYLEDKADGQYGILTAQSVFRAKYWLGYRKPDHAASDLLVSYLEGTRKRGPAMRDRERRRKRKRKDRPLRHRALVNLSHHLGEKEHPPDSNRVPWASIWWNLIGPWCAMAVSRAYIDAGSRVFKRGQRYAYVPFIVGDARRGNNKLTVTNHPNPGDLVCYDWQKDGIADHVGLFERWVPGAEGSEFYAIEGNTAVGNDSNGGAVMRRTRKRSQVIVFVHVGG